MTNKTKSKIPRKWQYIAKRCKKEGKLEASNLAKKIDKLVYKYHKNNHTHNWESAFESGLDDETINVIAIDPDYCTPCSVDYMDCDKCEFGKKAGNCVYDNNSLYQQFLRLI